MKKPALRSPEDFQEYVEPCPASGCWLWLGKTKMVCNYELPRATFRKKTENGARISWILHKGEIPKGLHVLHTCHNSLCVAPHHLYLGTHQQNMLDIAKAGKRGIGFDGLRRAHAMRAEGMKMADIANHFGVHVKSISRALNGGKFPFFNKEGS